MNPNHLLSHLTAAHCHSSFNKVLVKDGTPHHHRHSIEKEGEGNEKEIGEGKREKEGTSSAGLQPHGSEEPSCLVLSPKGVDFCWFDFKRNERLWWGRWSAKNYQKKRRRKFSHPKKQCVFLKKNYNFV